MTDIRRTKDGAYMVADLLEKGGCAPVIRHQPPLWDLTHAKPPLPTALRNIIIRGTHVPGVSFSRSLDDVLQGTEMTPVDGNAAYLSAMSSARFAHGTYAHTGPRGGGIERGEVPPGYYLVDVHHWQMGAPGSPLGTGQFTVPRVWVLHPTYKLLRDLTYGSSWAVSGHWPDATIHDSYTAATGCRFTNAGRTGWADVLRDKRAELILSGDEAGKAALKLGYSQAVQMWKTAPGKEKKNRAYRPDWYQTVHAQHAATMWRIAYRAALAGRAPYRMGGSGHATDGMLFTTDDLRALLAMPGAPLRLDETGVQLGTFKRNDVFYVGMDEEVGALRG